MRVKAMKAVLPLTLIAWQVISSPVRAEGAPKIGYVDVKAVATRSNSIQSGVKSAEGKLKVKQDEIESRVRELRDAKKDLDTQRSVMSEDEVKKQERKVQEMRDKVDGMQLDIDKELRRTESEVMGPAVDRIIEAVKRIGKAQGFDLVLTNDIVIYGAETLDLTPVIIQDLDSKAVKAPEPATAEKPAAAQPEKPKETPPTSKSKPKGKSK